MNARALLLDHGHDPKQCLDFYEMVAHLKAAIEVENFH